MTSSSQDLLDRALSFFKGMETSSKLSEHIRQVDVIVQFDPADGPAFHVRMAKGNVDLAAGEGVPRA
jgi:hypothetical protein